MKTSEFELIRQIVKQIPMRLRETANLQDDAAVLSSLNCARGFHPILTTDMIVENVDFVLKKEAPRHIGQKALAVNLSDIAAMGGTPRYFTIALGIPRHIDAAWIKRFYAGVLKWARYFNVVCAGGDISRADQLVVSITVLGIAGPKTVLRNGAKRGDWIGVTGRLGGSLRKHHLIFKPRIEEGRFLADNSIHAMIDISDGFVQDLTHILTQSKLGCQIELSAIPIAVDALNQNRRGVHEALKSALTDGEDFELLFTASESTKKIIETSWQKHFPRTKLSWVGRVTSQDTGWQWFLNGHPCAAPRFRHKGYQHFR